GARERRGGEAARGAAHRERQRAIRRRVAELAEERRVERQARLRRLEGEVKEGVPPDLAPEHGGGQERAAERAHVGEVVELDQVEAVGWEAGAVDPRGMAVPEPEGDLREAVRVGLKALGT